MQNVTPKVYLIAKTQLAIGFEEWLQDLGAGEYGARISEQIRKAEYEEGEALVESAARRCYQSFQVGLNPNVTKVRTDSQAYHENVLASGHGSVLAHCTASFAIENVSRVWTGEMNRHWAGLAVAEPDGISEGSMRYIRLDEMKAWNPWDAEMAKYDNSPAGTVDPRYMNKLKESAYAFDDGVREDEELQARYARIWKDELAGDDFLIKKTLTSRFRRNAPMGVATGGVWTFNMRSLRHAITLRSGIHVEQEMHLVIKQMGEIAKREWPMLFQDIEWTGVQDGWVAKYAKV